MFIIALFFLGCSEQIEECDTSVGSDCIDHRGYEHEVGTYWQCENSCEVCSCDENGDIVVVEDGPIIVSGSCSESKLSGPQLPKSPK